MLVLLLMLLHSIKFCIFSMKFNGQITILSLKTPEKKYIYSKPIKSLSMETKWNTNRKRNRHTPNWRATMLHAHSDFVLGWIRWSVNARITTKSTFSIVQRREWCSKCVLHVHRVYLTMATLMLLLLLLLPSQTFYTPFNIDITIYAYFKILVQTNSNVNEQKNGNKKR